MHKNYTLKAAKDRKKLKNSINRKSPKCEERREVAIHPNDLQITQHHSSWLLSKSGQANPQSQKKTQRTDQSNLEKEQSWRIFSFSFQTCSM